MENIGCGCEDSDYIGPKVDSVRQMPADLNSHYESLRRPYITRVKGGQPVDMHNQPVYRRSVGARIPVEEFVFQPTNSMSRLSWEVNVFDCIDEIADIEFQHRPCPKNSPESYLYH